MDAGISIRRLTSTDIADHRAAMAVYSLAFGEPENYAHNPPSDAYIRDLLASSNFIQLVAFSGDDAVGALSAYVLPKFEQERSEIYVYDLAVLKEFRRRGIAEEMIRSLAPVADEVGAHVIFVQADLGDDPAIALYNKLGLREDVLHFDLKLK